MGIPTAGETQPLNSCNTKPGDVLFSTTFNLETSQERKLRRRSLWIMYYTTLLQSIGGSIVITGMWPYLQQLDATVNKEWLGWVVAANPLGQLIFSPLVGWWCNRIESVRTPSLFCLALFILSNIWYAVLPLHDKGAVWFICVARFLVGVSSGSITACRTFITQGTLVSERTKAISHLSLSQALGFVLGPVGQLILQPLGSAGIPIIPEALALNMYTAVGWLTAALGLTNLILFHPKLFRESDIALKEAQMKAKLAQQGNNATAESTANNRWTNLRPDYVGIMVIVITFFIVFFNFVLLETLGTPVSIDQFGWNYKTAITNVGLTMIISSVVCTSIFFLIPYLAKRIDERILLLGFGIVPMTLGRLLFFPYFGDSPPMRTFGCIDRNGSAALIRIEKADDCVDDGYQWEVVQHGCPESQSWCFEMPALNPYIVALGYALCTLGFPFCIALSQTIFSKMIGPRPQGLWMGGLTAVSSLSRVIGPIFVTFIYTQYGTIVTSATATSLMVFTFFILLVVYKRLIPLVDRKTKTTKA